jgi:hypothetical protein
LICWTLKSCSWIVLQNEDITLLYEVAQSLVSFQEYGIYFSDIKGIGQNSKVYFVTCSSFQHFEFFGMKIPSMVISWCYWSFSSQILIDIFKQLNSQRESDTQTRNVNSTTTITSFQQCKLLVLERSIDWFTLLFSPLTYEALVDEIIGIKTGIWLHLSFLGLVI